MIASMTGFARREISGSWGALVCELRSVNHRFLESGFRLPDELRAAEGELRQRLARDIKRGKAQPRCQPYVAESYARLLRGDIKRD